MSLIAILDRFGRIRNVSEDKPLPVQVVQQGSSVPTQPSNIDTLIIGSVTADSTVRDLLNNTGSEATTIANASPYRRFLLTFNKSGTAEVTVTLKGRAQDASGNPVAVGWATIATAATTGAAAGHYRLVLQASDGAPLGYDQYRIEITSTASQTVVFSLKGER
jgi:hypothetical protein